MAYTAEVAGIIRWMINSGIPFKITDVNTPGVHAENSYHYQGLAVDLAGLQPSFNSTQLLQIFNAFKPVEHRLAELIYSGGGYSIKDGRKVNRYAIADHWNHVHVAVPRGMVLAAEVAGMPDDPNMPNITGPVEFHPLMDQAGNCTGYYIFSSKTGELHSFGPGAKFYGRSEVTQ